MNRPVSPFRVCHHLVPALLLVGCAHWEPYPVPSLGAPGPEFPSSLRVTAASAPAVVVEPFVQSDTLYGTSRGDSVAVPLQAIQALERQRLDGGRTFAAVFGGLAAWLAVGFLAGGME